jgi:glutamate racemase
MTILPTIGIIDSGAGGLSILKEILSRKLPYNVVYVSDNDHYPYGLLDESKVIERVTKLTRETIDRRSVDAYIIACNTASTISLPKLRETWKVPFIGVVPAIKPASKLTKSDSIGILATPGTVSRPYLNTLIDDFASDKHVWKYGSSALVEEAEHFIKTGMIDENILAKELDALLNLDNKIDCVVLACTHFPLLKQALEKLGKDRGIQLIDSTQAIVNRLEDLIPTRSERENGLLRYDFLSTSVGMGEIYSSYLDDDLKKQDVALQHEHLAL